MHSPVVSPVPDSDGSVADEVAVARRSEHAEEAPSDFDSSAAEVAQRSGLV